jgi:hypothetical protein
VLVGPLNVSHHSRSRGTISTKKAESLEAGGWGSRNCESEKVSRKVAIGAKEGMAAKSLTSRRWGLEAGDGGQRIVSRASLSPDISRWSASDGFFEKAES